MGATVAQLIDRTRRYLGGSGKGTVNRLNGAITDAVETLTLEFATTGVARGSILSIDSEEMHVWDVNSSTRVVTVERGFNGTTAAAHSDAVLVEVDARFSRPAISQALLDEVRSWPADLFTVTTISLGGSTVTRAYDLAGTSNTDVLAILDVLVEPDDTDPWGADSTWRSVGYRAQRNMPTADFASGTAVFLDEVLDTSRAVRVVYAKPFVTSTWTDATDVETTVGLSPSMLDIPVYGASWRLVSGQEVERSNMGRQGEPRSADEVPPGTAVTTAGALKRLRDQRVAEEAARLMSYYPVRF